MKVQANDFATHRAADLRYRLFSGEVSLAPLRILRCRAIDAHGSLVQFVILGASHAVVLERPNRTLTELLTCMAPVLDQGLNCRFEKTLSPSECAYDFPEGLGVDASRVELATFPLDRGDGFEGTFDSTCMLELDFPAGHDRSHGFGPPRTRIGWHVNNIGISVETIHTYPDESLGVRSRTNFVLGGAGNCGGNR